ncbi:hypothetical protein [Virgibacillus ndiopensis]|uniref:hypothetical protein n=1 Tax=Virgibacillus ndiopensis TaxID=2004408 RepID=UPI000C08D28C|nr:hypothetical protein [Virgibacillus ndiopensis]
MSQNKLIMDTLSPLNVPVSPMTSDNSADEYIIFTEYNESSMLNANDDEVSTRDFVQVDVFSNGDFTNLVKQVKQAMKQAGFGRIFQSESYEKDMQKYRKIIRFSYATDIQ